MRILKIVSAMMIGTFVSAFLGETLKDLLKWIREEKDAS